MPLRTAIYNFRLYILCDGKSTVQIHEFIYNSLKDFVLMKTFFKEKNNSFSYKQIYTIITMSEYTTATQLINFFIIST